MHSGIRLCRSWIAVCALCAASSGLRSEAADPTDFAAVQVGSGKVQLTWVNPESYPGLRIGSRGE